MFFNFIFISVCFLFVLARHYYLQAFCLSVLRGSLRVVFHFSLVFHFWPLTPPPPSSSSSLEHAPMWRCTRSAEPAQFSLERR